MRIWVALKSYDLTMYNVYLLSMYTQYVLSRAEMSYITER
jgi:hypothetical protein